jgi:hypothetical protein
MNWSRQKMPIRWLQGDSKIPLEPFLFSLSQTQNILTRHEGGAQCLITGV